MSLAFPYQAQIDDYQRQAEQLNRTAWMAPKVPRTSLCQRMGTTLIAIGTWLTPASRAADPQRKLAITSTSA